MAKKLLIEIELPYSIITDTEDDDDGCGSPSSTGNSMTGRRGSYTVCTGVECDLSDKELRKLVEEAMYEQNLDKVKDEAAGL